MTSPDRPRTYRFAPRDGTGWLLGLGAAQCLILGLGVLAAGALLNLGAPTPVVFAPILVAGLIAFGRWNGEPVYERARVVASSSVQRVGGSRRWHAEPPRRRHPPAAEASQPHLPPALAGQSILESAPGAWTRNSRSSTVGLIRDRRERSLSAVVRVQGRAFALCDRDEQEHRLQLWGDALASFCSERGPVGRFRWIEWAAPGGLDQQSAYLAEHVTGADATGPVAAYRDLLAKAGASATRHETLVVVTVEDRRLRRRRHRSTGGRADAAEDSLAEEVRLLSTRLETAGLVVEAPLSAEAIAMSWRARLDPYRAGLAGGRRSLAAHAGLASVSNAGPLLVENHLDHIRTDAAVHAAYVVAEWPRLDVPPAWMEPLLVHAGGIRTVAVHYEPVAPSRSRRAIERDTVKLASDEEQRARSGFRIGAHHRRAQADVLEREKEIVAGYGEFEYVGFVVVTARDVDELDRSCADYEQIAAQAGMELRRLDARHDLALACALPMGRGLARRRFP